MTKKIQCQATTGDKTKSIKIKVVRAPLVDSFQLRNVVFERARAIVL